MISARIQEEIRASEILRAIDRTEEALPKLSSEVHADANPLAPLVEELAGALADQTAQSRLLLEVVRSLVRTSEPGTDIFSQRMVAGTLLAGRLTFEEARRLAPESFDEKDTAIAVALCLSVLSRGMPIEEAKRAILIGMSGHKPDKARIEGAKEYLRALVSVACEPGEGEDRADFLEAYVRPLIELGAYRQAARTVAGLYDDLEEATAANTRARLKINKILRDHRARAKG